MTRRGTSGHGEDGQSDGGFLEGKRRSFLKLTGGGIGLSALGSAMVPTVGAQSAEQYFQVDLVEGTDVKDPLDADGYAGDDRLIRWIWGDSNGHTAEGDLDKYEPFEEGACSVTTGGIDVDLEANEASVEIEVNCDEDDVELTLVSYTAPVDDHLGWDPARAHEQEVHDSTSGTFDTDGTLTVELPTVQLDSTNFTVSDLDAPDVTRGEEITISATIENTGQIGATQDVVLSIDGTEADSTELTLGSGASENVSFDVDSTDFEPDDYDCEISTDDDAAAGSFTVEPAPATFAVSDLEADDVETGEDVTVSATITNTGDETGTQDVILSIDETEEDSTELTLESEESEGVSFEVSDLEPGEYGVEVATDDDSETSWVTVAAIPANFEVSNLEADDVEQGQDVTVSATITNAGGETGTQDVVLSIDDEEEDSTELTLESEESEGVSFDVSGLEPGEYGVEVVTDNDSESSWVTVEAPSPENQYYWTAADYDLEEEPSDSWEPQMHVNSYDIAEDDDGNYLLLDGEDNADTQLRFTDAPMSADTEVWARLKSVQPWGDFHVYLRGEVDDDDDLRLIRFDDHNWDEQFRLATADDGFNELAATGDRLGMDPEAVYQARARVEGNEFKARWWADGDEEPSGWDLEVEVDIDGPGYTGIGHWNGGDFDVYEFGVGVDGTVAPSEEVEEDTENLLSNASFEEQNPDPDPVSWSTSNWGGSATFDLSDEEVHDGDYSARISSDSGLDGAWSQTVSVEPDTDYELSGWIKTENFDAGSGYGAQFNVNELGEGSLTEPVTETQDWAEVSTTINSGEHTELQINCMFGGWGQSTGTAWYDNVSFEGPDGVNVLDNASFNSVEFNPADWHTGEFSGGPADFEYTDEESYEGDRSVRITSDTGGEAFWAQTVSLEPGTDYRLSGWMKTEDVEAVDPNEVEEEREPGGAFIWAEPHWGSVTERIFGTIDWTYFENEFNSDEHDELNIWLNLGQIEDASGTVWFDDVRLEEI